MGDQRYAPAALPAGKRPNTPCVGGWVGPRAGLDACGKSRPVGFHPRTVQPVVGRYTDYAIPAPKCVVLSRYIPRETQKHQLKLDSGTQVRILMLRDTICFVLDYCVCVIYRVTQKSLDNLSLIDLHHAVYRSIMFTT